MQFDSSFMQNTKKKRTNGGTWEQKKKTDAGTLCAPPILRYTRCYIHLFVLKGEEGSECRLTREAEERRRKGGEKKRKNCKWAHHTKWYLVCDVKPQVSIDIIVQFDSFMQNKSKKTAGEPKNKKKEKEKNEGTAPILHYYTRYSLLHFVKPELGSECSLTCDAEERKTASKPIIYYIFCELSRR